VISGTRDRREAPAGRRSCGRSQSGRDCALRTSSRPSSLFVEPIAAAETIARYVAKLAVKLCAEIKLRGLGARRLDLLFGLFDNRVEAIRVRTAQPLRDLKRLTRLLCDKIEKVDPGFGVEIERLAATAAAPFATRQMISSLIEDPEADVSGLIDIPSNRVGEASLYRFAPVASEFPERSVQRVAAATPASTGAAGLPIGRAPAGY
jgi:protein ImuB